MAASHDSSFSMATPPTTTGPPSGAFSNLPQQRLDHAGIGIAGAEARLDREAAQLVPALAGEDNADHGSVPSSRGASFSPLA
jgi:hypothetical protein